MADPVKAECARCGAIMAAGDVGVDVEMGRLRYSAEGYGATGRNLGTIKLTLCVPCSSVLDSEMQLPSASVLAARDPKGGEQDESHSDA
jgi:hypothetical protein